MVSVGVLCFPSSKCKTFTLTFFPNKYESCLFVSKSSYGYLFMLWMSIVFSYVGYYTI